MFGAGTHYDTIQLLELFLRSVKNINADLNAFYHFDKGLSGKRRGTGYSVRLRLRIKSEMARLSSDGRVSLLLHRWRGRRNICFGHFLFQYQIFLL
jgi:hypothetical protein